MNRWILLLLITCSGSSYSEDTVGTLVRVEFASSPTLIMLGMNTGEDIHGQYGYLCTYSVGYNSQITIHESHFCDKTYVFK